MAQSLIILHFYPSDQVSARKKHLYLIDRLSAPVPDYVMRCTIWYHLYNIKNMKNTHERVSLLVKLRVKG